MDWVDGWNSPDTAKGTQDLSFSLCLGWTHDRSFLHSSPNNLLPGNASSYGSAELGVRSNIVAEPPCIRWIERFHLVAETSLIERW